MKINQRGKNGYNYAQRRDRNKTGGSSWNKMAGWYDGMVGSGGHKYHQDYAIPVVIKLLDLKPGETVLEVGCGQGALSPYINKAGGVYYGVDASQNMIRSAFQRHRTEGKFFEGTADNLENIDTLRNISKTGGFDDVVFMLSIQDMNPLGKIVSSAAKMLKTGGKFIIFMLHPAFRIPRQSGWGEDKKRKIIYRRMDRYLSQNTIPLDTKIKSQGKNITSYFYHRPLETYFSELSKNGILIERLIEIAEEKKGYDEFPTFLAIRGLKA